MKIAIVGAGGVGGYFGAQLAKSGADVAFIARGKHLAAIRSQGLTIESPVAPVRNLQVSATDDPAQLGMVDLAILAVKLWDTATAAEQMRPLVGPATAVVSFQNGIDAEDILARMYGPERTLGGVSHIFAGIERPGVIRHAGQMARLTLGELDNKPSARVDAFVALCQKAGFEILAPDDIHRAIWEKFIFLSAFSGATALARSSIGPIREDPDSLRLFTQALAESIQVARARKIALAADAFEKTMAFTGALPPEMKSSMLNDLERGARLELPWLSGAICRLGRELSIPTPTHDAILGALKPLAMGRG
jgi:2-dehydropantoate 2-reductase